MVETAGRGPGYGESSEAKVQAEISIVERFVGTNVWGQSFSLQVIPLQPFVVEQYNFKKGIWELIDERLYTISLKTITFVLAFRVAIPPNPLLASSKNIRVMYSCSAYSNSELEATTPSGAPIVAILPVGTPTVDVPILFSSKTGKGRIERIVVVRTSVSGTPYTPYTHSVEIFDTTIGPPTDDGIHSEFRDINLEPDPLSGSLVNWVRWPIDFENTNPADFGQLLLRIKASGGDGTSTETFDVRIQGTEKG